MRDEGPKEQFVNEKMSAMTLKQKIGQCLVLGYVGPTVTPEIFRRVEEYTPAGIRGGLYWRTRNAQHDPGCTPPEFADRMLRQPRGTTKDFIVGLPPHYTTAAEYCAVLNQLKQKALASGAGIPLHVTFDHEGDGSCDFYFGIRQTPHYAGLAASGDKQLVHDVHKVVGDMYREVGFSWSHSLVLDVNTNPNNPEINHRSFGSTADEVIDYAVDALRGWKDANIIATGKHFPGRGESVSDAHHGLPVIDISRAQMEEHVAPYRALIAEGLPAVMTAHTSYPQLEPEDIPATLSKRILTGILKDELGFEGAITTDAMAMGGIVSRYEFVDACTMALNAGADLLLIRDEGQIVDELFTGLVRAVEDGRISTERIDDANRRVLGVKYDYNFFETPSPVGVKATDKAGELFDDPIVVDTVERASEAAVQLIRDEQNILPLKADTKVLLIEQIHDLHRLTNTSYCHPSLLWEKMLKHSDNVASVECHLMFPEEDRVRIRARMDEADVIVITNYYNRRSENGNAFIRELQSWGKPLVVVTNSPYQFTALVCSGGCSPECLDVTAALLYAQNKGR